MKKKQKKRVRCSDCKRLFGNKGARGRHWMTQHYVPYTPPPKPPEPEMAHKNFIDLVRNTQWGREYRKHGKLSPADNDIIMGLLALIVEELQALRREVGKTRTIQ